MEELYNKIQKGQFDPIPDNYSAELSLLLNSLLKVNPQQRPSCEEILKANIIVRKIKELAIKEDRNDYGNRLIKTIRINNNI